MVVKNVLKALSQASRLNWVKITGSNPQLVFGLVLMCVIIEFVSRALSIIVPSNKKQTKWRSGPNCADKMTEVRFGPWNRSGSLIVHF
jgi:hypothetical protein